MGYRFLENSLLGKPLDKNKHYNIVGAGIAGLLLGYHLQKKGISFHIYEKSAAAGGLLKSYPLKNGLAEGAANGFVWCTELQAVLDDLQLTAIPSNKENSAKFFLKSNRLSRFPIPFAAAITAIGKILTPHFQKPNTIADFGTTYLGKVITDQILSPAMSGIYAAQAHELSFPGALPSIARIVSAHSWLPAALFSKKTKKKTDNTTKKGYKGTYSFSNGMGELTAALAKHLSEQITYNIDPLAISIDNQMETILCVPAYVAAKWFKGHPISALLQQVIYSPIVTATFIFKKIDLPKLKPGFGCLIPAAENKRTMGILFNNYIFNNRITDGRLVSLTCITKGANLVNMPDADLLGLLGKELSSIFGNSEQAIETAVWKYEKGIPLYSPQLYESWFQLQSLLEKDFPHIRLFGNYTGSISIRGMCQQAVLATAEL